MITTSTTRGVASEVLLKEDDGMKTACAVNLHNAVTVSQDPARAAVSPDWYVMKAKNSDIWLRKGRSRTLSLAWPPRAL